MYIFPLALLVKAWGPVELLAQLGGAQHSYEALTWAAFGMNLVPVTIGNIIGGGGLVGAVYWLVYLRRAN
jgi:formate transporter